MREKFFLTKIGVRLDREDLERTSSDMQPELVVAREISLGVFELCTV
jgi:hypothetical protein